MAGLVYEFGEFRVFPVSRRVLRNRVVVRLSPREFDTLLALVKRAGLPVAHEELTREIWRGQTVDSTNLRQQVSSLRGKIGTDREGHDYIVTITGYGYQLAASVVCFEETHPSVIPEDGLSATGEMGKRDRRELYAGPNHKNDESCTPAGDLAPGPAASRSKNSYTRIVITAIILLAAAIAMAWRSWPKEAILVATKQLTFDGREKGTLCTDGRRIYFEEDIRGKHLIASVDVGGGAVANLNLPPGGWGLLGSSVARHSLLLASEQREVFELDLRKMALRRIPAPVNSYGGPARWDPSGRRLALVTAPTVLTVLDPVETATPRDLAFSGQVDLAGWDRLGRGLRFTLYDAKTGRTEWREWLSESSSLRILPNLSSHAVERGGISANDGRLFFLGGPDADQRRGQIWVADGDLSRFYRITNDTLAWQYITVLPESGRIAGTAKPYQAKLLSLPPPGSRLAGKEVLPGVPAHELDYSRDGKWIVYSLYPNDEVWRCRIDGTDSLRLTPPNLVAHQPHWSPDGRRIAFMGKKTGDQSHWRIYLMESNGANLNEVLPDGDDQGVPTWSPDGRTIVFGDLSTSTGFEHASLHLLDIKSRSVFPIPDSIGMWSPRLSPDGKYLAAVSAANNSLYLRDNTLGTWHKCVTMNFVAEPIWAQHSQWVEFLGIASAAYQGVYRVTPRCEQPKQVADVTDLGHAGDAWIGISPTDEPLFLQSAAEEVYLLDWRLQRRVP